MQTIEILRGVATETLVAVIKPSGGSTQVKKIMGDNLLNITFEDNRYIPFAINDYCVVFGEKYQLNQLPVITKISRFLWSYTMIMQAEGYDLAKAQYLFLGSDNSLRESDFSLMGTADDFMNLILANVSRVAIGFTKGQVIDGGYKNLTFSKENCYNALSRLAEEFSSEFWIEGKVIHLTKRSNDTGHVYKHGRNKGLYEITRLNMNDSSIVTRLYAYGSDKNLPESYISSNAKRLRLPGGYNPCLISDLTCTVVNNGDGTQTFTFSFTPAISPGVTAMQIEYRLSGTTNAWTNNTGGFTSPMAITIPTGNFEFRFRTIGSTCSGVGAVTEAIEILTDIVSPVFVYTPLPYIERNVHLYGVIEHTEFFEDIYPHRTGVVTGVNALDPNEFTDADIDFDVNAQLLPGLTAKITFNTGQLAGYIFEVESFNNGTKKFRIQQNAEERVLEIPSALLRPAIGDEYVLTDIEMPADYIEEAEAELLAAANALLVQLSEPQLSYSIVLDPAFIKRINRSIAIGDLVWIVDTELELQKKIRVVSVVRNIVNEYEYQAEISDIVSPGTVQRLVSSQQSTDRDVRDLNNSLLNNSILNNNVVGTLIFQNMPTTATMTGFKEVVIEDATGKLHKKV